MPSKATERAAVEKLKATGQASKADMTSRFVGLIVIPGKQIVKMEVEDTRVWPGAHPLSIRAKP